MFYDDSDNSLSEEEIRTTQLHEEFIQEHYENTGVHWRGNFDEMGPRPPPKLFMWDAREVGQTHGVRSTSNHW